MQSIPSAVVLALLCGTAGVTAGYEVALRSEHRRLEHNKDLVRMSHEKVWSERDNTAASRAARAIYSTDFVVHDSTGDSSGLDAFIKELTENRANFPDWTERVEGLVAEGGLGRCSLHFNRDSGAGSGRHAAFTTGGSKQGTGAPNARG